MAFSLNKVMLIGNLGRDPEMRYTPDGKPVTNFSVATTTSRKNKTTDEWEEEVEWTNISVWGDKAERAAESLRKGSKVYVEGRKKTTKKERDGGKPDYYVEVIADMFIPLTPRGDAAAGYGGDAGGYTAPAAGFGSPEPVRAAPAAMPAEGQFRAPAGGFGASPTAPSARPAAQPRYDDLDDLPF